MTASYISSNKKMTEEAECSSIESSGDSTVTVECLQELLEVFITTVYKAKTADRRVC